MSRKSRQKRCVRSCRYCFSSGPSPLLGVVIALCLHACYADQKLGSDSHHAHRATMYHCFIARQILPRQKLLDLVKQIDPNQTLDTEVEEVRTTAWHGMA